MISALVLFTNILSTFWYQYQIDYHYSLIAVPALAIGTVYAVGAMRDHAVSVRGRSSGRAVTAGWRWSCSRRHRSLTAYLWAPMPLGRTPSWYGDPDGTLRAVRARTVRRDPGGRGGVGATTA